MKDHERKQVCDWAMQVGTILSILDQIIAEQEDRNTDIVPRLEAVRDAMKIVDKDLLVLVGGEEYSSPLPPFGG